MKNLIPLCLILILSLSSYAGVVDDHWSPGEEMGPPDCDDSDGGQGHVGNPVHAGMGNKFQGITVYEGIGTNPLTFAWNYNSELVGTSVWKFNLQRTLNPVEVNLNEFDFQYEPGDGSYSHIEFDNPVPSDSSCSGGPSFQTYEQISPGGTHKVVATTKQGSGCEILDTARYFNSNGQIEHYSYTGSPTWNNSESLLSYIDFPNGERHTYQFDPVLKTLTVLHSNGQSMIVSFTEKDAENGATILLPSQLVVGTLVWTFDFEQYEISTNNKSQILKKINGPNGTSNEFSYYTEIISANLPSPVLKVLLTDRYLNDQHVAGWVYNENYRAYRSYHGPNTSSNYQGTAFFDESQYGAVELVFNPSSNSVSAFNEHGKETDYGYHVISGYQGIRKSKLIMISGMPSTNCLQSYHTVFYDQYWRISQTVDSNNQPDTRVYTSGVGSRGRLKKITYALGSLADRIVNYEYADEDKNLISKIIESRITTEFEYYPNGRLKEKKQIDTTPHTVPYSTNGKIVKTAYTYEYYDIDQRQLKKTVIDGPRTDVNDLTTMHYDTLGRLTLVENALGHNTTFSNFNEWNFPETITKMNTVVTMDYESGFNKPLLNMTQVGNQSPQLTEYNDYELPEKVTYPSGAFLKYFYLTMDKESLYLIENNLGEQVRIDRDIDSNNQVTNFTREIHENSSSTIGKASFSEVYDALGRLYQSYNSLGGQTESLYNENNKHTEKFKTGLDGDGSPATIYEGLNYDYRDRLISYFDNDRVTYLEYTTLDQLKKVQSAAYGITNSVTDAFGNNIQIVSPDSGKTIYYYDSANNLTKIVDAENITKELQYDALNRVTNIIYPLSTSENIQFVYDGSAPQQNGEGKLTSITGPNGTTTLFYDEEGNISTKIWVFNGQTYTYNYNYVNGLLQDVEYPSGRTVSYSYDALGRVSDVAWSDGANSATLVDQIVYNPFGPLDSFEYGNGVTQNFDYDSNYRLNRITATGVLDLEYGYDDFESVTEVNDLLVPANTQSFRYNLYGELKSALGSYGFIEYYYDDIGNRIELTKNGTYHAYEYNSNGRLNRVFNYTDWQLVDRFRHRKNGDVYELGSTVINMNHAAQVGSIVKSGVTTQYLYGYNNLRAYKSTGNIAYHYNESGQLIAETNASTGATLREYYYLGPSIVASLVPTAQPSSSSELQYVHLNHIGAPMKVTNHQQQVVWSATYDPFGEASISIQSTTFNIRFPGQYYDAESGLHYNWHRYYSPKHGRYLQSDPIGLKGGVNAYAYVSGNPVNLYDLLGLCACTRPTSNDFWNAYPNYNSHPYSNDVWGQIGGSLEKNYGPHSNSCAARVSHGLNNSGAPIPPGTPGGNRNWDGNDQRYIISAQQLNNYLQANWGAPAEVLTNYSDLQSLQGSLSNGEVAIVVSEGHAAVVTSSYTDPYVAGFLGNAWLLPTTASSGCSCP